MPKPTHIIINVHCCLGISQQFISEMSEGGIGEGRTDDCNIIRSIFREYFAKDQSSTLSLL